MLSQGAIIPRSIKEFNSYIAITNSLLIQSTNGVPNWQRYKWTSGASGEPTDNVADWQAFLADWKLYYSKYQDKKGQRTSLITGQLHLIIMEVVAYDTANRLIHLIKEAIGLTALDCETWNLPLRLASTWGNSGKGLAAKTAKKVNSTIPTTEGVYPKLIPAVGGLVRCKCFTEAAENGRPRKLAGFDLIEYAFGIFYSNTADLPVDANDPRLSVSHSSRASFLLPTAGINKNLAALAEYAVAPARVLVIFFRYANSKHPNLNGPYNGPFSTVLL